jgi:hypothetical protein
MKTKFFFLTIIVALCFSTQIKAQQINSVETYIQSVGVSGAMISVTAYGNTTYYCSIVYGHGGYGLTEFETGTYFLDPNVEWTIPLENLLPGTTYVYMVKVSWDNYNYTITSSIENFSTCECPMYASLQNTSSTQCSAQLEVIEPNDPLYSYQWLRNGEIIPDANDAEYNATTSGNYSFRASSLYCDVSSDPVYFEISKPELILVADSNLCAGQNTMVFAGNYDEYLWEPTNLFDDPHSSQTVFRPIESTVIILTGISNGCTEVKQQFIAIHELPQLGISFLDSVCIESNEPIQLIGLPLGGTFLGQGVFNHGNDYATFNANQVISSGIYPIEYVYHDQYGCGGSIFKQIVVTEEPVVNEMLSKNNNLYVYGIFPNQILISINGQNYYSFQQNETEAIFPNVPVSNGDYVTIMAMGTHGCFITKEFRYGLGYNEAEKDEIEMYPNPFSDILTVEIPDGKYEVEVIDLTGNIAQMKSATRNFIIERNNLPVGIYYLRIISSEKILTKKIQVIN